MADSLTTTLVENVVLNLTDTDNYSAIASKLQAVFASQEFALHSKAAIYAVVIPDNPQDVVQMVSGITWWQPIDVFLCSRRGKTWDKERTLLGTSGTNGLDTLAKDARQALNRPSPFNDRKPTHPTGTYATQTGVHDVRFDDVEYLVEQSEDDMGATFVARLRVLYYCVDSR